MKNLLFFFLLAHSFTFGQTDLQFDLTVRVSSLRDRSESLPDVRVTVMQGDSVIFSDCTDITGKVYLDTTYIRPNSNYQVLLSKEGFHEDKKGVCLTTGGLEYDQNFMIDMCLLERTVCLFDPCYDPSMQDVRIARYNMAIGLVEMQRRLEEREEIRLIRLAVFTHGDSTDNALLREAKTLQEYLGEHLPGFSIDKEIRRNLSDSGLHESCVGVMLLLIEEENPPSQSNTK